MVKTTSMLLEELGNYADRFGKIKRLCAEGKLYPLTKGIYETDGTLPGYLLAPVLYGPSYLSFDYALSEYGLIPEGVREYTCATHGKGKRKNYSTHFGDYSYRDIPSAAFPFETLLLSEGEYSYSIATPEKALCDKLYTLHPVKNLSELERLLFEDLRINEEEFAKLNPTLVAELSELYHCNNIRFFSHYIRWHP